MLKPENMVISPATQPAKQRVCDGRVGTGVAFWELQTLQTENASLGTGCPETSSLGLWKSLAKTQVPLPGAGL